MSFGIIVLGGITIFILALILAIRYPDTYGKNLSWPMLVLGLIMMFVGGILSGIAAVFELIISYWYITLPLTVFLLWLWWTDKQEKKFSGLWR